MHKQLTALGVCTMGKRLTVLSVSLIVCELGKQVLRMNMP